MSLVSTDSSFRGPSLVPGVSPYPCRADDGSHTSTKVVRSEATRAETDGFPDSAFITFGLQEKHYPDPAWTRRIIEIGGRNLYGAPHFRAAWGFNELQGDGELRFPHRPFQWLLLRWWPASEWGTRRQWYAPTIDGGQWAPSDAERYGEDYPALGAYEIDHYFEKGVRFCLPYIEDRLLRFVHRDKLAPVEQRMKNARAELTAEEDAREQADYERFTAATRAFFGAPFVGYGAKQVEPKSRAPVMTPEMLSQVKRISRSRMARRAATG